MWCVGVSRHMWRCLTVYLCVFCVCVSASVRVLALCLCVCVGVGVGVGGIGQPYKLFRGLQIPALEELQKDISVHKGLDASNAEFWDAMTTVCIDELQVQYNVT